MNKEFFYLNRIPLFLLKKVNWVDDEINTSGSRYPGKTHAITTTLTNSIAVALKYNLSVAWYCFRKLNKDITELDSEIYNALTKAGFIEGVHFTVKHPNHQSIYKFFGNKSFIRVMGIYSNRNDKVPLKGLGRREIHNFDLAVTWREEANEFTNSETQAIRFALGRAKKIIEITSCNPDLIYEDHVAYLNSKVPFNIEIMKTKYEQLNRILDNGKYKVFHYINWKLNEHNLSPEIINNLEELKELDPARAESWYWGVPGVLTGAIFARYLDKIKTNLDFQPYYYRAGLDIGTATSPTGHPTAASLWCLNNTKTKAHKLSEFYHSNVTMTFKDTHQLASSIIDYYMNLAHQYPQLIRDRLYVNVDYGNGGQAFIDVLEKQRKDRNLQWLIFRPVDKSIFYLKDRIDFTTIGMIKNILSFNWNNCPESKRQYSLIQWLKRPKIENINNEVQMLDLHDDTWDSDCFALMDDMKELLSQIGNELLLNKKRGVFNEYIR